MSTITNSAKRSMLFYAARAPEGPGRSIDAAMTDRAETVVVGGGQAGLAASRELTEAGVPHVVLERGRVGQTWRGRWDSFCLVTPNWSVQLPGHHYDGDDPDGFMPRDGVVGHLERYAAAIDAPVHEGVDVTALRPRADGAGLLLETSAGDIEARRVVLSTGAYQRAHRPPAAARSRRTCSRSTSRTTATRTSSPPEPCSSWAAASRAARSPRSCTRGPRRLPGLRPCAWAPRRISGHDLAWWRRGRQLRRPRSGCSAPAARLWRNFQASGPDGGHDLHYGAAPQVVTLLGRFLGAEGRERRSPPT